MRLHARWYSALTPLPPDWVLLTLLATVVSCVSGGHGLAQVACQLDDAKLPTKLIADLYDDSEGSVDPYTRLKHGF